MTGASWTSGSGTTSFLTLSYDNIGRRTAAGIPSSATSFGYDGIGRLASDSHQFAGGAGNLNTSFGYNPASQIVTRTRDNDDYRHTAYVSADRTYAANGLNQYTTVAGANRI